MDKLHKIQRNEVVPEVNSYIMSRIDGEDVTFRSSETVWKLAMPNAEMEISYTHTNIIHE
jgi:hypothetical protein